MYIDLHCDTLSRAMVVHKPTVSTLPEAQVDVDRLVKGGAAAQFFAAFLNQGGKPEWYGLTEMPDHFTLFMQMREVLQNTLDTDPRLKLAKSYDDYKANLADGKVSAFLTIENGYLVDGRAEMLEKLKGLGVSLMTLTWNDPNCFGFPNSKDPDAMALGLTDFGKEAVPYMNDLGILVDVSHLSDGGFYDVAACAKKPFVASHSNVRECSPFRRNLTDDMLKLLAEKGGVTGLNFCTAFLRQDTADGLSEVKDMVRHVLHMLRVGGEECLALGTDFDGIGRELEIDGPDKMDLLWFALGQAGISDRVIEKMMHENVERVLKECL